MRTFSSVLVGLLCIVCTSLSAQEVSVKWELSDKDALNVSTVEGDGAFTSLVSVAYEQGSKIQATATMANSGAASGYAAVAYTPAFTQFTPTTRVESKTDGHNLKFVVTPSAGHKFKPLTLSFDAAKCGTDGGNFDVYVSVGTTAQKEVQKSVSPLRNKIQEGNTTGYSYYEYSFSDYIVDGKPFAVYLYVYNFNGTDNENPKSIAFRNVTIKGAVDEEIFTAEHFLSSMTCSAGDLTALVSGLKYGESVTHPEKQYGSPTDFAVVCKEGYTADVEYADNAANVVIKKEGSDVFKFTVRFKVTNRKPKPAAKPLNRGLLAVKTGSGVFVSWRLRATDDKNVKFNLYRGKTLVNKTAPITATTNYLDKTGNSSSYYSLEVLDKDGNVIERQDSVKAWANTYKTIPTSTPVDLRGTGATYTPNDCSLCDMDGDGEYEIIVKWDPSNSKDPASSGVTGSTYLDCYKMDGTQLWRIDLGQNIRSGAHTTPFLCYDFDQDGYGELIVKTAPGTVDGEGNFVVMGTDDPHKSYASNGRIMSGPEYLTVFDGITGGEIHTIKYHTTYSEGASYWGDTKGNRSDRYLACMAYLDGEHPSAVMCRGYYSGAFVAAYDFDGDQLTQRWYHKSTSSGKGLWGEGAHCITVGDVDNDGKDEITYGSAAIDDDGTLLYRTGLKHGDALHMGDFIPERPGLEVFMVHESSPYGFDIRDARTGELIVHNTGSGDTGRGLMADFDDKHDGAECMASHSASLFDCYGQHITNWQVGTVSSSSINFRIYWDGDLQDEYMDRCHIDKWDSSNKSFGRVITLYDNGSTTINSTKNNPNLQADFLGDWREEVIHYLTTDNSLIITTTDKESYYKMPTLMDDRQYCEAIVWQNVAYNQPPHVSFDPVSLFTVERNPVLYAKDEPRWDAFFTTYPVYVPDGCEVYTVGGYAEDSLKLVKRGGTIIPANTGVLIRSDKESLLFKPSAKNTTYSGTNYLKGACVDSVLVSDEGTYTNFYIFKDGEHGLGYYKAQGDECNANEAFLRIKGSASKIPSDYYIIGRALNPTSITDVETSDNDGEKEIYTVQGVRVDRITSPGVYVINGKKTYMYR